MDKSEEVAIRELRDETGLAAEQLVRISANGYFDPATDVNHFVSFLALGCREVGKPRLKKTEIAERVILPIPDWLQKIWDGKVPDAKSVYTTFMALPKLGLKVMP